MFGLTIGFLSAVGTALMAMVSTASPALVSMALEAKTLMLGSGSLGISDISFIIKSIMKISDILGIINGETKSEELGVKATLAEKQPEDFDNIQKYIEYLNKDISIDKGELEKKNDTEIFASKVLGSRILLKGVEENIGVSFSPVFLEISSKNNLSPKEMLSIAKICGNNEMSTTQLVDSYMENKLSLDEKIKVGNVIIEGLKEVNPSMTSSEIEDKLVDMELKYDRG